MSKNTKRVAKRIPTILIPECPAAEKCKTKKADCKVCESLSEESWREHVRKVLARS